MSTPIPCEQITWNGFHALCRRLAQKIRAAGFHPDIIIAIGRGGYMPGRVLSDLLDQKNLTSFKIEHYRGHHKKSQAMVRYPLAADLTGLNVLLVDDVDDSGDTLVAALQHLQNCGAPAKIRTAVLHHKAISSLVPDFYGKRMQKWRWIAYPWATTEDVRTFISEMSPQPEGLEAITQRLTQDHGIKVPKKFLQEIINSMQLDG
jgi:hypoxanthine phosphoribosyltransferase